MNEIIRSPTFRGHRSLTLARCPVRLKCLTTGLADQSVSPVLSGQWPVINMRWRTTFERVIIGLNLK